MPSFPTPVYITPPLKGSPWNFVTAAGLKTKTIPLSDHHKSMNSNSIGQAIHLNAVPTLDVRTVLCMHYV